MEAVQSALDLAKGFGTAAPVIGLLLWLYTTERAERKDLTAKVMDLTVSSTAALKDMTTAVNAALLNVRGRT
jgi:hypothetical protein